MGSLHHRRHLIVTDVSTCALQGYQTDLVKDVQCVQVVLVNHYLQVLAILLQVHSLEFSRLIIRADVIIQRKVTQASETDIGATTGCHEVRGP